MAHCARELQRCRLALEKVTATTVDPSEFSMKFQERFSRLPTPTEMGTSLTKIAARKTLNYKDRQSLQSKYLKKFGRQPSKKQLDDMQRDVKQKRMEAELSARLVALDFPTAPTTDFPQGGGRKKKRRRCSKKRQRKKMLCYKGTKRQLQRLRKATKKFRVRLTRCSRKRLKRWKGTKRHRRRRRR